ncbi:hypothetical protein Tco_0681132 [Tanacetum coccineum]|uniref:Uncharacterized protein n=1 Tax=Tanacetum coccineum TaxID=301880 RepID=A0ABQ4XMF9_9ASTR
MEKTYTWIKAREVATNGAPNDQRDNFEKSRKYSEDNDRGQKSRDMFSPYQGPNHGLLSSLSKSPREILATEKVAKTFEQPPRFPRRNTPGPWEKYRWKSVDSMTSLVGFSGEYSWPLGEVPLKITIGESLLTITKMLNLVIVRSDSPHNLLLGRTAMKQMWIVVSTIHGAIKFHMQKGICTLLSENSSQGPEKEQKIASNA